MDITNFRLIDDNMYCTVAAKDFEDSSELSKPQHPVSYMEVLEMLERGQTPPGIRVRYFLAYISQQLFQNAKF